MSQLDDMAWTIIEQVSGCERSVRDASCLFFATAAAAALGRDWRFAAGGAFLASSQAEGWGISVSPAEQKFVCYASQNVDSENGSYIGHCWVETSDKMVVDIMEGYYGPHQELERLIVYYRVRSLERSIKAFYAPRLRAIRKAVRRNADFVAAVRAVAASVTP